MKLNKKQIARYFILLFLLVLIGMIQFIPSCGAYYAGTVYPKIAFILSSVSRIIPFSLGDLFIFLSISGLVIYPFYGRYRRHKWKTILRRSVEYLLWVYVWFYLAWGLNYSQPGFYQRTSIPFTAYTPENFHAFLDSYIENLNAEYVAFNEVSKHSIHQEIVNQYNLTDPSMGIQKPLNFPRVKKMLFPGIFTATGISGYMGPFFCEFHVNQQMPGSQYPSTYAHEMAHYLGISSEAEANFYAYIICTGSTDRFIRFSGYLSILNHVLSNAYYLLPEDEYRAVYERLRPEVIELAGSNRDFWVSRYNRTFGSIQDWVYNLYLKGNRIESGTRNYSEVIGLLISWAVYNSSENINHK